jgi:hypothetical protein
VVRVHARPSTYLTSRRYTCIDAPDSRAPNQVHHYFRDDETEEIIETRYANDLPVPGVGEVVEFASLPIDRSSGDPEAQDELDVDEDSYVVTERSYQYVTPEFPDDNPASDQELTILGITLYVEPYEEDEPADDAEA